MLSPKHSYTLIIENKHMDMFGHVNHAIYLEILEEARWDWISGNGYGPDTIKETGQGPTILEVNLKYRREITEGEEIRIESQVPEVNGKIFKIYQEIFNQENKLCNVATLTCGLFDLKTRKLILPSDAWKKAIGLID